MKRLAKVLMVLALGAVILMPGMALAGILTTEASFLADIQPGYYLNEFTAYNNYGYLDTGPLNFSGGSGPFSYGITSPDGGLYGVTGNGTGAISTLNNSNPLLITFTSNNVTAVGGQFFLTDYNGLDMNGQVTVTLSDSTTDTITMSGLVRPFWGYSSAVPIQSLSIVSIRPDGQDTYYPTVDHLYAGTQVPIPPSALLLGSGLLGLVGLGWRRRKTDV